jgi:predicted MFS family arabinose efflux permease
MAVNGFEGMVRPAINQALGPAVAGAVVGSVSPAAAIGVAVVASAAGLLVLTTVPRTPVRRDLDDQPEAHPVAAALRDVQEGFGYMMRTGWLLSTLLFAALMLLVIMGPIEVLIPFLIKDQLGGGPGDHAMVLVAFGVGGALASLAMASVRMPRRYLTLMNLGWGVGCLPLVVIGMAEQIWVVVVSIFVLGAMFSAPMVIWGTLLQRRVPPALLGRVSALDFFVSLSLMPVSMALAGPVAEAIGLRTTFAVAGVVPGVVAVVAILAAKQHQDELAHPLRD